MVLGCGTQKRCCVYVARMLDTHANARIQAARKQEGTPEVSSISMSDFGVPESDNVLTINIQHCTSTYAHAQPSIARREKQPGHKGSFLLQRCVRGIACCMAAPMDCPLQPCKACDICCHMETRSASESGHKHVYLSQLVMSHRLCVITPACRCKVQQQSLAQMHARRT